MYFITCFNKIEKSKGWLDIGASRVFGYLETFKEAEDALNENCLDMWETIYHYAMVEEIEPGIHSICYNRWFFQI